MLTLVGTPIGNLGDLSPRGIEALAAADAVACEDTRRTGRLLAHIGVRAPVLIVMNDHTEGEVIGRIIERLTAGERVAVVSDAGMPGISDPGERLVAAVSAAGLRIEVVPGPSAAITALVGSGLPAGRFVFEGFLPRKGSGRAERLRELATESRTVLLYEAPHRLERTLTDLVGICGSQRQIVFARELTKLHEEFWRGTLAEAISRCGEVEPRGEYVLVLAGAPIPEAADDAQLLGALRRERENGSTTRDAVALVAEQFGASHRRVYSLATGSSD